MHLGGTVTYDSVATAEFVPSGHGTTQASATATTTPSRHGSRAAWPVALNARDALAVLAAAFRSALGAIDDAGAVDVPGVSAGGG